MWTPGEVEVVGTDGLVVRGESERMAGRDLGRHQPDKRENWRVRETQAQKPQGHRGSPRRDPKRQRHTEVKGERQTVTQAQRVSCYQDREKVE